jgi:hypothetical protein
MSAGVPAARRSDGMGSGWGPTARRWLALSAVIVLAAIGGMVGRTILAGQGGVPGVMPVNPAVEQAFGVRLTHIGVSADGGLIDMRYLVLDPGKADALTETPGDVPRIITEDSGVVLDTAAIMGAHHDLQAGRTAFLLYRNTGGAVRPGTVVTVVFNDLRIEHVVAE